MLIVYLNQKLLLIILHQPKYCKSIKSGTGKYSGKLDQQCDGGSMAPKEETARKFQTLLKATGATMGAWSNHRGKQSQQQQQRQSKGK